LTVLMVVFHLGGVLHIGDTFFHFRNFLIDQWPVVIAGTLGYLCSGVLFLAVWYPYWIRKQVQHMADSGMRLTEAHSLHPKNNKHLIINRGVFWPLWLLVTILDNPLRRVFNYIFFDLLYQWFLKHWDKAVQAAFPDAKTRDPDRG
jgi:hypothetical protein